MAETLYLIDGHAQMYRCYYAPFRELNSPTGEPTRATYVFSQMLLTLIRERKPTHLAMAVDVGGVPVFRDEIFPAYKANREPPPEDFPPQQDRICQIVEAAGIPIIRLPGFEADDVLATLAERARGRDMDVYFVSKDKDLEQLLSDRIRLYDPNKDEVIDAAWLRETKGYGPEQAVDIQTLTGDNVDNVPGVKGIGPKTAAKLIAKYGSAEAVVAHAEELTPAQKQNVLAFAPQLALTRQLVTLCREAPVREAVDDLRFTGLNVEAVRPFFESLGFARLLPQLDAFGERKPTPARIPDSLFDDLPDTPEPVPAAPPQTMGQYTCIDTLEAFEAFLAELRAQPRFAIDTETTSLDPMSAELVGMSFAWRSGEAYYLPFLGVGPRRLDGRATLEQLRPILEDASVEKIGQNLKYDLAVLSQQGMAVNGIAFDTMIASFVLDATRRSHSMDALALEVLGYRPIPTSDLIGTGRNQIRMDQVEIDRVCAYAAEDADVTWRLYEAFREQLAGSDVETLFRETEMPLVEVLAEMEQNGVAIDTERLAAMSNTLAARLKTLTDEIHAAAGRPFNIDSPKQLAEVLFDKLGLRVVRRTKTARSTDADSLATLAAETGHAVPRLMLEYREVIKLKNTYVDVLPEMINERTGRVHASFNQTGTVTGRLSSSDPNLQNIPIRTELGREIRKAFVPCDADHLLLTADYSQIELRVLAHFCRDSGLMRAFAEGQDIHAAVASQVFDVPLAAVTKAQRGRAKAVNFGIIYGQGPFGLARQTGISQTEAKHFIDAYFRRYPGIREFIDR